MATRSSPDSFIRPLKQTAGLRPVWWQCRGPVPQPLVFLNTEDRDCTGLRLYLDNITVALQSAGWNLVHHSLSVKNQDDTWQQVAGVLPPVDS